MVATAAPVQPPSLKHVSTPPTPPATLAPPTHDQAVGLSTSAAAHDGGAGTPRQWGRVGGVIWIPVLLVTGYYCTPVVLHPLEPVTALIVIPGLVSCAAVALRHRHPRLAMGVALACLVVNAAALGGVVGLIASRARHLPGRSRLPELVAWVVAAVGVKAAQLTIPHAIDGWLRGSGLLRAPGWGSVDLVEFTISVSLIGFALLAGLLAGAWARSAAAERNAEQARAAEIRLEERARIAREMHDVVAHRISLVAMTSGALVYRDDLPPDAHEAATIIQSNARLAMTELRAVLSDLREAPGTPAAAPTATISHGSAGGLPPEAPQPTLADLAVLLAEARSAGVEVNLNCTVDAAQVPESVSRHLFRIVQEGLTNARKHAGGQPVSVLIERAAGDIVVQVRNPLTDGDPATEDLHGSRGGYGLVGIQERARLLGGTADVEVIAGRFVLTVRVPAKLIA